MSLRADSRLGVVRRDVAMAILDHGSFFALIALLVDFTFLCPNLQGRVSIERGLVHEVSCLFDGGNPRCILGGQWHVLRMIEQESLGGGGSRAIRRRVLPTIIGSRLC